MDEKTNAPFSQKQFFKVTIIHSCNAKHEKNLTRSEKLVYTAIFDNLWL